MLQPLKLHPGNPLPGLLSFVGAGHSEKDVLLHRKMGKESKILKDHPHSTLFRGDMHPISPCQKLSIPAYIPLLKPPEPPEKLEGKALSRSAGAEEHRYSLSEV
jgi:hypothetical protein